MNAYFHQDLLLGVTYRGNKSLDRLIYSYFISITLL